MMSFKRSVEWLSFLLPGGLNLGPDTEYCDSLFRDFPQSSSLIPG
jgi:hypothetical protein